MRYDVTLKVDYKEVLYIGLDEQQLLSLLPLLSLWHTGPDDICLIVAASAEPENG